ncbi:MAG: hypothetical protein ACJ8ER_00720 [Allosphingosinicella sp.]
MAVPPDSDALRLLREALAMLERERREPGAPIFDFHEKVIEASRGPDLGARIEAAARDWHWHAVADLLANLSWCLPPDEESALFREAESWLVAADDERRAAIALNLEIIPLSRPADEPRRTLALQRLRERFPPLAEEFEALRRQLAQRGERATETG